MPPKGRIKHANQHDRKHDTGLAAPGKRISKEKANAGANGHANGKATQASLPAAQLASGSGQSNRHGRPELSTTDSDGSGTAGDRCPGPSSDQKDAGVPQGTANHIAADKDQGIEIREQDFTASDTICTKDAPSLKAMASQASSTLALAATILSACPLRDAIAILILLLSLPPTLIITIHTLFASLTFVPPAAGFSWSSGTAFPSLGDWFHATPGGGPSPFTILISDIVMTVIYLVCPLHLQNIFMDLGQAVIAISLSGAAAGSGSSSRSVAFCTTIILCSHVFRYKSLHANLTQYLGSTLRQVGLDTIEDQASLPVATSTGPVVYSWPRLMLGCHILAQGLLTLIRRWFAGAAQKRQTSKLEAEQASLSTSGKLAMLQLENEGSVSSSTDGRPPGPPPTLKESKGRLSNSKIKRKQANQARSQQPLWAAIASTKVTFMKELEHKQLSQDAAEASQTQPNPDSLSNLAHLNDRLWITDISPTHVRFNADLSLSVLEQSALGSTDATSSDLEVDRQVPFYIRLNGADWSSTRIVGAGEGNEPTTSGQRGKMWLGEIFGLSPLTSYTCEVVRMIDQKVVCVTNLVTVPAPSTEQAMPVPSAPAHQALRPMSPTSTLKQSVTAAEAKREETRSRLKRTRKDHKSGAAVIRREIDLLQSKVASSGGQDERSRQRILQLKQHVKQAEEATDALREEGEHMGETPQEDLDFAAARRKSYDAATQAKKAARSALDEARSNGGKEVNAVKNELTTIAQKRDRLTIRRTKLGESIARLESDQSAATSLKQSQDQKRADKRDQQGQVVGRMIEWVNNTRYEAEDYNIRANHLFQEIQVAERSGMPLGNHHHQPPPTTPEGNLPGTNGPLGPISQPFEFVPFGPAPSLHGQMPSFQQHVMQPPWNGTSNGIVPVAGRQRSSSMLSGYSGFTEDLVEAPAFQTRAPTNGGDRKGSEGSRSSGGSSAGEGLSWAQAPAFASAVGQRPASADFKGKGGADG